MYYDPKIEPQFKDDLFDSGEVINRIMATRQYPALQAFQALGVRDKWLSVMLGVSTQNITNWRRGIARMLPFMQIVLANELEGFLSGFARKLKEFDESPALIAATLGVYITLLNMQKSQNESLSDNDFKRAERYIKQLRKRDKNLSIEVINEKRKKIGSAA